MLHIELIEKKSLELKIKQHKLFSFLTFIIFISSFIKFLTTNPTFHPIIKICTFIIWLVSLAFSTESLRLLLKFSKKLKKNEYYEEFK